MTSSVAVGVFTGPFARRAMVDDQQAGWHTFGRNDNGQLALDNTTRQPTPQRVAWEGPPILDISCGHEFTLLLDTSGAVSASGAIANQGRTFSVVEGLPPCRAVVCGADHALAVAEDDTLWAVPGSTNDSGELGLGHFNACPAVQQVAGLAPVVRVAAGYEFTVVEVRGGLLAFGSNTAGQLGSAAGGSSLMAQEVPVPDELQWPLRSLACGFDFFAAVDASGVIWTCDGSSYGQLGRAGGSGLLGSKRHR